MTRRAEWSAPAPPAWRAGGATHPGHRRAANEDAFGIHPRVVAVADGMGGHRAGEVASRLAIETLGAADPSALATERDVRDLVTAAHERIVAAGADPAATGLGTTLVGVAALDDGRVAVFHVGDTRCYRFAHGTLTLATRDHTPVQELIDAGGLDPRDARRHPLRNVVTRALGVELGDGPDITVLPSSFGRLLLCSDGLWGSLEVGTIGRVLAGIADPQAAADRLVELALAGPARDNITAAVVDAMPSGSSDSRETGNDHP